MASAAPLPLLVLDTNCVLALWMFRDPGLTALRADIEDARCRLFRRDDALEELRRVLSYPQFGLAAAARDGVLDAYRLYSLAAPPASAAASPLPVCSDADDQKFLEIARDAGATFLLTRDKALLRLARHRWLRERFRIMTPEAYLRAGGLSAPAGGLSPASW